MPLPRDALQRGGEVFRLERLGEELFRPGPHRPQDQIAVGRAAGDQDRALGRRLGQRGDQLQRLVRIAVERDEADVGIRLPDDVGKELVARALGFEPDGVEAEQRRLQRVARRVFRVDDSDSQDVAHECEAESQGAERQRRVDFARDRTASATVRGGWRGARIRPYSTSVAYGFRIYSAS